MLQVNELKPGDILILTDIEGCWAGSFEFVGPCEGDASRVVVRDRAEPHGLFNALLECLCRPIAVGAGNDDQADQGEHEPEIPARKPDRPDGITAAQRRRMFARAHELGMDTDDLRAMTPEGSVSKLTRQQAAQLIDRLCGNSQASGPAAENSETPTTKQLRLIARLRDQIGFSGPQFTEWLTRRFKVNGMEAIADREVASRVIGGLMAMQQKRSAAPWKGPRDHRSGHSRASEAG